MPSVHQVSYIKHTYCESRAVHKVITLCSGCSASKIIHHLPLRALGQHPGIRQRDPHEGRKEDTYLREEQTEVQREHASSLSCPSERHSGVSNHQAYVFSLCHAVPPPAHKGQCPINPFPQVEFQAIWWHQWRDTWRSFHHQVDHLTTSRINHPKDLVLPSWPLLDPVQNCLLGVF